MATKQAIPGTHISAFAVDPNELVIVGLDKRGSSGWLTDARSQIPLSPCR